MFTVGKTLHRHVSIRDRRNDLRVELPQAACLPLFKLHLAHWASSLAAFIARLESLNLLQQNPLRVLKFVRHGCC